MLSRADKCVHPFSGNSSFKANEITHPLHLAIVMQCLHVVCHLFCTCSSLAWLTANKNEKIVLGSLLLAVFKFLKAMRCVRVDVTKT